MTGRLFWGALLFLFCAVSGEVALAEGKYQSTRDGKTLVWNNNPKPGDVATWSGARDRSDHARGFGRLSWYTRERGNDRPQLFARYWGRMVDGKFEGPVNVHSKRETYYAIFIGGTRVTRWTPGSAPGRATDRWRTLVAQQLQQQQRVRESREPENVEPRSAPAEEVVRKDSRTVEPEPPAAGPRTERSAGENRGSVRSNSEDRAAIQELLGERWPKIDIDDSIRILAFPPRTLRR